MEEYFLKRGEKGEKATSLCCCGPESPLEYESSSTNCKDPKQPWSTGCFWAPNISWCIFCIDLASSLSLFPAILRQRARGESRQQSKLAGPLPGQETEPCCGSHRIKKESLWWHGARWIRRLSPSAGIISQAFLSPGSKLLWA